MKTQTTILPRNNGAGHARKRAGDARNWRDEAMNEALRGFNYAENLDALLREIRRRRPGAALCLVEPARLSLLRFLQQEAAGFRSLLSGSVRYEAKDKMCPFLGWYAVEWEGSAVEVALAPSFNSGDVICIAEDPAVLDGFAAALTRFTERPLGRCLRYSNGWSSAPDLDSEIGAVTWDDIVLLPDLLARVREAVEGFASQRDTFAALGFPWRRGILLIGPPGTGKTLVCKAAAAALPDLPFLYVRDLHEDRHKREAIRTIFERARRLAPCLLAIEDLDGLVSDEHRTVFLNELDGFGNNEGLLLIASSNHPERIDEALLKRPSRFDRVFHLGPPAPAERRAFCERLLSRSALAQRLSPALDRGALAREIAERTEGFTPAYLKEIFLSAALRQAQEGASALDERFAASALAEAEALRKHLRRLRDPEALAVLDGEDRRVGFRR